MADVWRCLDRWKRTVILPEVNWEDKILIDHPALTGNELSVEQTLVDPDMVMFDRIHSDREVYYKWGVLPPPDHQAYLKVCVGFRVLADGEMVGRVITAFVVDRIQPRERTKWRR